MGAPESDDTPVPTNTQTQQRLAEVAYTAYCDERQWKGFNGDPLPLWNVVRDDIKSAWVAAIDAVLLHYDPSASKKEQSPPKSETQTQ